MDSNVVCRGTAASSRNRSLPFIFVSAIPDCPRGGIANPEQNLSRAHLGFKLPCRRSVALAALMSAVFLPTVVSAQTEPVRFLETRPRFSAPGTTGMLQDRYGFIWICTPWRLLRYDGSACNEVYGDSLRPWQASGIAGGRHNFICMYARVNQLLFYDVNKNSIRLMSLKVAGSSRDYQITCVTEDSAGRFWIGCSDGNVLRISPPDTSIEHIVRASRDAPAGPSGVRCIAQDSLGNIWIGGDSGMVKLLCWTTSDDSVRASRDTIQDLPASEVVGLQTGRDGRLWVCFIDGTVGWIGQGSSKFFSIEPLPPFPARTELKSIAVDGRGDLWLGCNVSGLHQWVAQSHRWENHLVSTGGSESGHQESVVCVMADRSGTLWVMTLGRGLLRYVPRPRGFHAYDAVKGPGPHLSGADVTSALVDHQGVLWVGRASGGIDYLEPGKASFGRFFHDPENPNSLGSNYVVSICERRNGDLWFGTAGSGVNIFDRKTKTFRHAIYDPKSKTFSHPDPKPDWVAVGFHTVTALYEDSRGTMWVGHYKGIDTVDPGTNVFSSVLRWPEETLGLVGSVTGFREDSRGNIWVGTAERGLLRMGTPRSDTTWYRHDPGNASSLPDNWVTAVLHDREGRLWVATDGGLGLLDDVSGTFQNNVRQGPSLRPAVEAGYLYPQTRMVCRGILQDRRGDLWVSFPGGVAKFDPELRRFRAFGVRDGLIPVGGMRGAFFVTKDGTVYCGGTGGINWFDPDSISDEPFIPQVAITEFRTGENAMFVPPGEPASFTFSHTEHDFVFGFAMLDFRLPEQNTCAYMLEGWDRDWLPARESRVIYTNIQPGAYTFRVRGLTSDGYTSKCEATVQFTISPPFWKTWWFAALALALVGSLTYSLIRDRLARVRATERLRLRIADDIHDDIGSELSGIALESDLIARLLPQDSQAHARLMNVSQTIRRAGEDLRDVVWIVNPELDSVPDLLARMKSTAERMLLGRHHTFDSPTSTSQASLGLEFKRHVLMMFKEMLTNVVRHSQATTVTIEVTLLDGRFRLCVIDNGKGFDTRAQGDGRGLASLRNRASAIGGVLTVESEQGSGTRLCLTADITRSGD